MSCIDKKALLLKFSLRYKSYKRHEKAAAERGHADAEKFRIARQIMEGVLLTVAEMPSADAVKVVRCKDCKLRHSSEFCECRDPMAFCSDGVRRTDA